MTRVATHPLLINELLRLNWGQPIVLQFHIHTKSIFWLKTSANNNLVDHFGSTSPHKLNGCRSVWTLDAAIAFIASTPRPFFGPKMIAAGYLVIKTETDFVGAVLYGQKKFQNIFAMGWAVQRAAAHAYLTTASLV